MVVRIFVEAHGRGGPGYRGGVSEAMDDGTQGGRRFRPLGGVVLPAWSVRGLAGVLLAGAVAMPWLAQWQGVVVRAEGETVVEDAGAVVELRPELVRVPGGRFRMGSERWDEDEKPVHEAEVAAFEMCRTEVTQGQWKAVMGTEPFDCAYGCGDEYPAHDVSWNQAVEFMNELTERENALSGEPMTLCYTKEGESWSWTKKDCTGYRLPTETEWEYAARADSTTEYSFGDDAKMLDEYGWYSGNSGGSTRPVQQKKANPWGLYDVHGNVWEWVWDWNGGYRSDTGKGHVGPQAGEAKVLRGGSFRHLPQFLRSAYRNRDLPAFTDRNIGLRCARGVWLPEPRSTP